MKAKVPLTVAPPMPLAVAVAGCELPLYVPPASTATTLGVAEVMVNVNGAPRTAGIGIRARERCDDGVGANAGRGCRRSGRVGASADVIDEGKSPAYRRATNAFGRSRGGM